MFTGNAYSLMNSGVVVWIDGQEVVPGRQVTIYPGRFVLKDGYHTCE